MPPALMNAVGKRKEGRRAYKLASGGIVADSDPRHEFQETVNKAKAIALAETFGP
jgi:anthranilate/para-aminobenzoate synthase component I